jgi:hypothetical protein
MIAACNPAVSSSVYIYGGVVNAVPPPAVDLEPVVPVYRLLLAVMNDVV